MKTEDAGPPLSETESALFAAVTAMIRTLPPGPHRVMLAGLLEEQHTDFLQAGRPQAAALMGMFASYAATGDA